MTVAEFEGLSVLRGIPPMSIPAVSFADLGDEFVGDLVLAAVVRRLKSHHVLCHLPGDNPGANRWFLESTPIQMPIRFAPGLPPGRFQGWNASG